MNPARAMRPGWQEDTMSIDSQEEPYGEVRY